MRDSPSGFQMMGDQLKARLIQPLSLNAIGKESAEIGSRIIGIEVIYLVEVHVLHMMPHRKMHIQRMAMSNEIGAIFKIWNAI
jgi:hypothetical protein